jgi:hydrophobe/amphiphile efflux-3 (HAE3) family protein
VDLVGLVSARPRWTLAAVLLATAVAVTGIVRLGSWPPQPRLQIDPSINRLLAAHDDSRQFYERTRQLFGSEETIVVALASDDVFTPDALARLQRITRRVAQLDGVDRVVSLFTALDIRGGDEEGVVIEPFLTQVPGDPAQLAELRARALLNPVYTGNLIAKDGRASAVIVYLEDMPESEFVRSGLDERIEAVVREEQGPLEAWITGAPHVKVATSKLLATSVGRTIPVGAACLALVAFLAYRSRSAVLVPLAAIGLADVWILGTMGWFGYPLNIVTLAIPSLVQTIGFTYTIHVVSEWTTLVREAGGAEERSGAAGRALRALSLALFLSSFTTVIGFGSLLLSPLVAVREFGLIGSIGVIYSWVLAVTFAPAALALAAGPGVAQRPHEGRIERLAVRIARFDVRHRRVIMAGALALLAVCLYGALRIRVSTDFVSNFSREHPARRDFEAVSAHLGGAGGMMVVLDAGQRDAFKDPANLRELEALQRWLEQQPEVGSTTSLADYVKAIHWGFNRRNEGSLRIPESPRLVAQLLFFGASPELLRFVDSTYGATRILVRYRAPDSAGIDALLERIDAHLRDLPAHLHGRVTGGTVLLAQTVDGVSQGQVSSLSFGLLLIFGVMVVTFRSLRVGFWAMVPNALPIAFYFGMLGFSGITLNATTALVACLALGIAVDDTIHLFVRFRNARRAGSGHEDAAVLALRELARPVLVSTVALALGFGALMSAPLKNQAEFGGLAALTLLFAGFMEFAMSPAVAVFASGRRDVPGARRG